MALNATTSQPNVASPAAAFNSQQWLDALHANGLNVALPELLWYQRHTKVLNLQPTMAIQSKLAGTYLAKTKGRGMEFDEVRHYQPGDDVRAIDWRVTARTGKVHTKLFREEKERPVFILTDLGDTLRFGSTFLLKSVQAAHLASLIGWHCKAQGDKLGGLVFSQQHHCLLKPASRTRSVLRYLQALVDTHEATQGPYGLLLANALAELRRLLRPGSLLYVISDFQQLDQDALRHLQLIAQHNEVHCCHIIDPLELALPDMATGEAQVQAAQQIVTLTLSDQALRQRYAQQQHVQLARVQQQLQQLGCKYITLSSALPLLPQLAGPAVDKLLRSATHND